MRAPDFWRSRGPVALLLAPLGVLYGASVALKARLSRPFDPGIPVICVGNPTVGGAGSQLASKKAWLGATGTSKHWVLM